MTPEYLAADVVARMTADLRVRFPAAEVAIRDEEDVGLVCEVLDDGVPWGFVGMPFELDDDDIPAKTASDIMVGVFADVFDNLWPDELTDPWPQCHAHEDEPLQPKLVRGGPCWACGRDDRVVTPLGLLGQR